MPQPSRYFRKTEAADPDIPAGTNGRKKTCHAPVCRLPYLHAVSNFPHSDGRCGLNIRSADNFS